MDFKVYRTWEWENATKMKFDSLEELLDFIKQEQADNVSVRGVIIAYDKSDDIWEAEIYDDYRE